MHFFFMMCVAQALELLETTPFFFLLRFMISTSLWAMDVDTDP